jgi:hypothetical protein
MKCDTRRMKCDTIHCVEAALSISLYSMFVDSVGTLLLLITGQMFPVISLLL